MITTSPYCFVYKIHKRAVYIKRIRFGTFPKTSMWRMKFMGTPMNVPLNHKIPYGYKLTLFKLTFLFANQPFKWAVQLRHNEHDGISNHQPHDCLINCLFRRISKKTTKPRVTGLCVGNPPVTGEIPAQRASYAENVSIWWRHHGGFGDPHNFSVPLAFISMAQILLDGSSLVWMDHHLTGMFKYAYICFLL